MTQRSAGTHSPTRPGVLEVLSITGEEGRGNSPLERFFADEGLPAAQAVCFACTDAGAGAWGRVGGGGGGLALGRRIQMHGTLQNEVNISWILDPTKTVFRLLVVVPLRGPCF